MAAPATNTSIRDVDFLPVAYREIGLQRKNFTLRAVVVTAFIGLVGFAVIYQQHVRVLAKHQLADLLPSYEQSQAEAKRLAELQQLSQSIERQAELDTYLKHPWPRSQIFAAVIAPLPEEIELEQLSIVREPLPAAGGEMPPAPSKPGETAQAKLDPAQRDLAALRDLCDRTRMAVQLSGVSDDSLVFHRYLEELGHSALFTKVVEGPIESISGGSSDRIHFTARIIVRSGYGQPNGPTAEVAKVSSSNNEHEQSEISPRE